MWLIDTVCLTIIHCDIVIFISILVLTYKDFSRQNLQFYVDVHEGVELQ